MRIKNPDTGEILEIRSTVELSEALSVTWESQCNHTSTEVRCREVKGGSRQYRHQCLECGEAVGNSLPKADYPDAKPFDESFLEDVTRSRERLRWKILQDYLERHSRRELDSQRFYDEYLASPEWKERRKLVLDRANGLCEGCRKAKANEVHHLTYRNFGEEFLFQLVAVCTACHDRYHEKREDDHFERPCRSCRYQSDGVVCARFATTEADALSNEHQCGSSMKGFEPLK